MTPANQPVVDMDGAAFSKAAGPLLEKIAGFLDSLRTRPVTVHASSRELIELIGDKAIPEDGIPADTILHHAADLLFSHSLHNGHPRFMGYITSSAAPLGALADVLAATVNANVGAHILSPVATEIEKQVIKWLAAFIGVPPVFDGILVSGGNMANFTAFFAAIAVKLPNSRQQGLCQQQQPVVYCSKTTHTWIEKAASLSGIGTNAVRWIPTTANHQMDLALLEAAIKEDQQQNRQPLMVIGTAGDVSTGAIDDLQGIAATCRATGCWFHVDGAYGVPAAVLPELYAQFKGLDEADSIALDPHKWLYAPLEAGCTLVKNANHLVQTYSSHPVYYNFGNQDEPAARNFYEFGLQNSRGFRALKVWMLLQQAGRNGYMQMIRNDIRHSKLLFELAGEHPELEAVSQQLSITTLRYCAPGMPESKLNALNEALLNQLQTRGEAFLSNAVVAGKYCLRSCIVNFRTTEQDIRAIIEIIVRTGRELATATVL